MWQLRGGREAAGAFTGDAPEILQNPLYQARRGDLQQRSDCEKRPDAPRQVLFNANQ